MQRYFLNDDSGIIKGQDYNHIVKVMRMKTNDEIITCFNNHCFLSRIIISDNEISYTKLEELKSFSFPDISIIQGLPKNPKSDLVVKYQTIFGVSNIFLVPMNRSVTKIENENNKISRLNMISKEASELSHRFSVPKIFYKKSIKEIDYRQYDIILLADENEKTKNLRDVDFSNILNKKILLIIGPEGGISDNERTYFNSIKATPISLGNHILPTEIAAIYVLSYLSSLI